MQNDLISKNALMNDFSKKCYGECCYCPERDYESGECGLIYYAPTVNAVNAVKVVRCKMCAHYETDTGYCNYYDTGRNWDDYCSRGVKNE